MEVLQAIYGRRAILQFKSETPSVKVIEDLLADTVQAPNSINLQAWSSVVIQGRVLSGDVPFEIQALSTAGLAQPKTQIMLNLAHPDMAFSLAKLPSAGVGLARLEFIIGGEIGLHPMAAAHPDLVAARSAQQAIARLARGYRRPGTISSRASPRAWCGSPRASIRGR